VIAICFAAWLSAWASRPISATSSQAVEEEEEEEEEGK
jgi:hypothetical protein